MNFQNKRLVIVKSDIYCLAEKVKQFLDDAEGSFHLLYDCKLSTFLKPVSKRVNKRWLNRESVQLLVCQGVPEKK